MADELKLDACPFCGADLIKSDPLSNRRADAYVHPFEPSCPVTSTVIYSNAPDSISRWNRRAPAAPPEGVESDKGSSRSRPVLSPESDNPGVIRPLELVVSAEQNRFFAGITDQRLRSLEAVAIVGALHRWLEWDFPGTITQYDDGKNFIMEALATVRDGWNLSDGAIGRHVEVVQPIRERPISSFDKGEEPSAPDEIEVYRVMRDCGSRKMADMAKAVAALYTHPSTGVSRDEVARKAADWFGIRSFDKMAKDKADLRLKMRSENGFDINEPTQDDCLEFADQIRALIARGAA